MYDTLDAYEINMKDLDVSAITISKPKKVDNSLFAKIKYKNNKLLVYIYNANIVHHKVVHGYQYSIINAIVGQHLNAMFSELDAYVVDNVIENTNVWFNKGLEGGVVEEYYTPTVGIINRHSKTYGIKINVQNGIDQLSNGCYDLLVCLTGVRFYKQRFVPEWELVAANLVEDNFLNQEHVFDDDDVGSVGPCRDDLQEIADEMQHKTLEFLTAARKQKREIKAKLAKLERIYKELSEGNSVSSANLDRLYKELVQISGTQTL
jgi:hypothetical protein